MSRRIAAMWPALVVVMFGCSQAEPDTAEAGPEALILGDMMTYSLAWERAGTRLPGGGAAWASTNNLGIEFEVDRGFLVTNRMELLPCAWPPQDDDAGPGDLALRLLQWLTGSRAMAGHSGDPPNSTRTTNWAEPIHDALSVSHSAHETTTAPYCQFSYAVARADTATTERPDEPYLIGASLVLSGRWRGDASAAWQTFDWTTAMPWGVLWDFVFEGAAPASNAQVIAVTVTRPLAGIFAGLNPAEQSDEVLGNKAVQNLVQGTHVTLDYRGERWLANATTSP